MSIPSDLFPFVEELAAVARAETLLGLGFSEVHNKGESAFDPVTEADRKAEQAMRKLISERYPDHGVCGEEWPDHPGAGPFSWSLDPIDGTRSYICQLPTWVTLAALVHESRPVLGVIDAPCLDELYLGSESGSWLVTDEGRAKIHTSGCGNLSMARLSTTDPFLFDGLAAEAFKAIRESVRTTRYGHDGYAYARLAAGTIDLVIESGLRPHDYNALIPVIRGAGGTIGDWQGGQDFSRGNVIAAATTELYDVVVKAFYEGS